MSRAHPRLSLTFAVVGLVTLARAARADPQRPLLVAVELAPGVRCEPMEVRRVVGDELKAPVMAPWQATSEAAPDTLIVSLDRARIAVSMRAGPDRWVSRTIGTPAEPAARLRAIAWLAGNVARDQVSSLLEEAPKAEVSALAPPPASVPVVPVTAPPPLEVVAASPSEGTGSDTGWRLSAFGGPAYLFTATDGSTGDWRPGQYTGLGWQVELQRRRPSGSIVGFALQSGPESHLLGAGASLGSRWSRGRWSFEVAAGGGIELGKYLQMESTVVDSSRDGTYSTTQVSRQTGPALYARADATAGVRVGQSLELLARLGVDTTTMGLIYSYLAGTLGMRFEIP